MLELNQRCAAQACSHHITCAEGSVQNIHVHQPHHFTSYSQQLLSIFCSSCNQAFPGTSSFLPLPLVALPAMNRVSSQPAKKRKTGGIQQRLAKAEAQDKEKALKERERLALSMATKWAWGHLSPQEIQITAADAIADMKTFGMEQLPQWLSKFAALGSNGVHSNNMHLELLKMFEPQSSLPKPLVVHLVFKDQKHLQSLMLPHELFSALYHHYPSTFQKHFMPGGTEQVSKFWSKFAKHPSMEGHEIFASKNYQHRALPLNLHGDGVPVTGKGKVWVKMMLTLSWTGCLAEGSSKDTCNLIWGVPWKQIMWPHLYQCVATLQHWTVL